MTLASPITPALPGSQAGALFQPGRIGRMTLHNRMVQAPVFTQFVSTFGEVDDKLIEYHRARARGGVGLIITENTSVDWGSGPLGRPPDPDRPRQVHRRPSRPRRRCPRRGREEGRAAAPHRTPELAGNTERNESPLAPTADITSAFGTAPRAIEEHEIPGLIDEFVQGARRAVAAGFDAVELHGAHGYLLGQFLSPYTNKRTDSWGGSLDNRARFALEVVRGVREQVGSAFPVLYRVSVTEPYRGGLSLEDGLAFCEMLEPYIDALNVTAGNYDTASAPLPMAPPGSLVSYAKDVKKRVSVPVIGVGRLTWLLDEMSEAVENGDIDFVAMGRPGLADPETVAKTRRGEPQRVRRCIAVNECVSRWMFNGKSTQCVINPALGQERRAADARRPAAEPQRVLVVGAGPSGCEAAILAADRGHTVDVLEHSDRIGGQLHAWAAARPFSAEVANMIRFYESELERVSVAVRLGTDAADINLSRWDTVLLASGTVPQDRGPDAVDVLTTGEPPEADEVTVFGETETAMFAALWLAEQGKKASLVSPSDDVGVDSNDMERGHLASLLETHDVSVSTGGAVPTAGTVLMATARTASTVHANLVDNDRVLSVGTRTQGGRMYEATQSGFWAAARIGDVR